MPIDRTILGLRFGSNMDIQPTQGDLRVFLASPKKPGSRELHGQDLAAYIEMLDRIEAYQLDGRGVAEKDYREMMYYGALGHTAFFNPKLMTAVEHYKYQLHELQSLDFRKPSAFIKAAQEEIAGLNPKKSGDASRIARLQSMADDRKRNLEILTIRRKALTGELLSIARYIRDNLIKIWKLCEGSIVILVDMQVKGKEPARIIDDVKEHFKEQLKDLLQIGGITREQLEAAKRDVAALTQELSSLIREDVFSLSGLLEAVHGHAKKFAAEIDELIKPLESAKKPGADESNEPYEEIERTLVSLVSTGRFELRTAQIRPASAHTDLLVEKRKELLGRFLAMLEKDRRGRSDRRQGEDRRKFNDLGYTGPERRKNKDRRSGRSRR